MYYRLYDLPVARTSLPSRWRGPYLYFIHLPTFRQPLRNSFSRKLFVKTFRFVTMRIRQRRVRQERVRRRRPGQPPHVVVGKRVRPLGIVHLQNLVHQIVGVRRSRRIRVSLLRQPVQRVVSSHSFIRRGA